MPNLVSECCHRTVVVGSFKEFPLGGSTWYQSFKVDVCECCGKECDEVEACEVCGVVGCGECDV